MAIKMTPSELRDLAGTITSIRDEIADLVTRMDNRINEDTANWDGNSRTQYFSDYEEIIPTLTETFPSVIEGLASSLNFAADTMENADNEIADAYRR